MVPAAPLLEPTFMCSAAEPHSAGPADVGDGAEEGEPVDEGPPLGEPMTVPVLTGAVGVLVEPHAVAPAASGASAAMASSFRTPDAESFIWQ